MPLRAKIPPPPPPPSYFLYKQPRIMWSAELFAARNQIRASFPCDFRLVKVPAINMWGVGVRKLKANRIGTHFAHSKRMLPFDAGSRRDSTAAGSVYEGGGGAGSTLRAPVATARDGPPADVKAQAARRAAREARLTPAAPAPPRPEVHIIGEIAGATGFTGGPICCKWSLEAGDNWEWVDGPRGGQTHTVHPDTEDELAVWAHPIDVHYVAGALHDWPRLVFQVWQQDSFGRLECLGYGTLNVPPLPGSHELVCPIWRPVGSASQEAASFFLGGYPTLRSTSFVGAAPSERYRLTTAGSGSVRVTVDVVTRNMGPYGVDL